MWTVHRGCDGDVLRHDRKPTLVYWHGAHLWREEIIAWRDGVRVVRLLSHKVLLVQIRDGDAPWRLVLIRVLGSRVFRGFSNQGPGRMGAVLVFCESIFATETTKDSGVSFWIQCYKHTASLTSVRKSVLDRHMVACLYGFFDDGPGWKTVAVVSEWWRETKISMLCLHLRKLFGRSHSHKHGAFPRYESANAQTRHCAG